MTSTVLNNHAPMQAGWFSGMTERLGQLFAEWSSRNANGDVSQLSAHQLQDIGLTPVDKSESIVRGLWSV
jgi:uncharacterized protein YjiS (DUF1127 family)